MITVGIDVGSITTKAAVVEDGKLVGVVGKEDVLKTLL